MVVSRRCYTDSSGSPLCINNPAYLYSTVVFKVLILDFNSRFAVCSCATLVLGTVDRCSDFDGGSALKKRNNGGAGNQQRKNWLYFPIPVFICPHAGEGKKDPSPPPLLPSTVSHFASPPEDPARIRHALKNHEVQPFLPYRLSRGPGHV